MSYVTLTNVVAAVVVLGIMILIHELGHFLAAKGFGVRVEVFSIGFGRRLFGRQYGETDYRISVLPLGGYVKMAGENPADAVTGEPGEFLSKPRWQRFVIAVMGPAMNVVLAVVLLTGLYMVKYQKLAYMERRAELGYVEKNSAAAKAGLQPGDVLVRLDGLDNPTWETVEITTLSSPGQPLEVIYMRNGQVLSTTLTPDIEPRNRTGVGGFAPYLPAVVKRLEPGLPAARAGLQPGDVIDGLNGQRITFRAQLPQMLQQEKGKPARVTVKRDGREFDVTMTPVLVEVPDLGRPMWRLGVDLQEEMVERRLSLPAAFKQSLETNRKFAVLIFDIVGKMLERKMSPRTLEGPIGIARLSGEAARQGLPELISLMAAISLNLGIFNLFPIPVLDGGVMMLLLIESLLRRDLSLRIKERIVQVGFVFLVLIAVFVIYNDIVKSLPARFEKLLP